MLTEKPRIPIKSLLLYGFWPGFVKILLYRLKGYHIGKNVRMGIGSVICGDRVTVGDHTSIGFLTIIRGKEIHLEPYVQIGALTFLDTPYIRIGEGTKINEQVFVGGLQAPDSKFSVGRNCQIMQLSFINPAESISIGDDSGIGGHCLIFGHSSFLNQFEGYATEFAPIEIGNGVGLSWRVFVLPGTKIGDGSMIGANSLVSGKIPPSSMAVGFPARIVGRPPVFPKKLSPTEKVDLFRKIVEDMIQYLVKSGFECERQGDLFEIREPRRSWRARRWRLQAIDGDVREALKRVEAYVPNVFLSLLAIPEDARESLSVRKIMWIDIDSKAQPWHSNDLGDEVIHFFRRYGVRTLRYPRPPAETKSTPEGGSCPEGDQAQF